MEAFRRASVVAAMAFKPSNIAGAFTGEKNKNWWLSLEMHHNDIVLVSGLSLWLSGRK
jgi:hypothetical protein